MEKTKYPGVYYRIKTSPTLGEEKVFYIRYYDPDRKRHLETVGSSLKGMTEAKANMIRTERVKGKELPNRDQRVLEKEKREIENNRWTISKLWAEYQKNKVGYKGLDKEKGRFNLHIEPSFGITEPKDIIALDVDRLRNNLMKKKKLSPQTVKNTLELLKRIVNYGWKKNLCQNLSFSIEMPVCDNVIDESLSDTQIAALLHELNQDKQEIVTWLMKVMLFTGRRTGEIEKLQWKDIDTDRQEMTLIDTKTKDTQVIPFSNRVKMIFESMPRFHKKHVFPNKVGTQRKRSNKEAKEYLDRANIPENFRPTYSLRHTFASVAASNDVPDRIIKALMGHKTRQAKRDITSRYAHVSKKRLLEAANSIADILDGLRQRDKLVDIQQQAE